MCFHKYEKLNKKVYTDKIILLGDKQYDIYNLYKCKKCGKLSYKSIYRHYTCEIDESMDFEQKLKDLDIQNNMDYLLSQ